MRKRLKVKGVVLAVGLFFLLNGLAAAGERKPELKYDLKSIGGRREKNVERADKELKEKDLVRKERKKLKAEKRQQKIIQKTKETADVSEKKTIKIGNLRYKTEKECLDILVSNPDDKKTFDNLVELYKIEKQWIKIGKELYSQGKYQEAIKEFEEALSIKADSKKVKRWIKKAEGKAKSAKRKVKNGKHKKQDAK